MKLRHQPLFHQCLLFLIQWHYHVSPIFSFQCHASTTRNGKNKMTDQQIKQELAKKGDDWSPYNVLVLLATNIPCINTEKGARNTRESNIKLQNRFSITRHMNTMLPKYYTEVCLLEKQLNYGRKKTESSLIDTRQILTFTLSLSPLDVSTTNLVSVAE